MLGLENSQRSSRRQAGVPRQSTLDSKLTKLTLGPGQLLTVLVKDLFVNFLFVNWSTFCIFLNFLRCEETLLGVKRHRGSDVSDLAGRDRRGTLNTQKKNRV